MSIQAQQMQRPLPSGSAAQRAVAGRALWQRTAHGPDTGVVTDVKTGEAATP
jgi:hypothetical protein